MSKRPDKLWQGACLRRCVTAGSARTTLSQLRSEGVVVAPPGKEKPTVLKRLGKGGAGDNHWMGRGQGSRAGAGKRTGRPRPLELTTLMRSPPEVVTCKWAQGACVWGT